MDREADVAAARITPVGMLIAQFQDLFGGDWEGIALRDVFAPGPMILLKHRQPGRTAWAEETIALGLTSSWSQAIELVEAAAERMAAPEVLAAVAQGTAMEAALSRWGAPQAKPDPLAGLSERVDRVEGRVRYLDERTRR